MHPGMHARKNAPQKDTWRRRPRQFTKLTMLGGLVVVAMKLSCAHARLERGTGVQGFPVVPVLLSATTSAAHATQAAGRTHRNTDEDLKGGESQSTAPKSEQEEMFDEQDKDHDGRVTRKEFTSSKAGGGSHTAFSCLDADMDGYITKEEQNKLKKAFYRSHLSQLDEEELMDWLTYKKCVPFDFSPYRAGFAAAGVNGLSLWEYAVKSPALLKDELNIKNINARRTLVEAVCREIEGLGCLGPPSSQAGDTTHTHTHTHTHTQRTAPAPPCPRYAPSKSSANYQSYPPTKLVRTRLQTQIAQLVQTQLASSDLLAVS